jgi:hypothetical protein
MNNKLNQLEIYHFIFRYKRHLLSECIWILANREKKFLVSNSFLHFILEFLQIFNSLTYWSTWTSRLCATLGNILRVYFCKYKDEISVPEIFLLFSTYWNICSNFSAPYSIYIDIAVTSIICLLWKRRKNRLEAVIRQKYWIFDMQKILRHHI